MLLVLLMLCLMTGAGFWQLDRAGQKILLQNEYQDRITQPAMTVIGQLPPAESIRFRQIRITGRYDNEHQFLLDNRSRLLDNGRHQTGYEVLTPLKLNWGGHVLVNRGWVPADVDRMHLPELSVQSDERQLSGIIHVPEKGFTLGDMDSDTLWPRRIQYIDFKELDRRLPFELYPAVLMLNESEADGFQRDWQPVIAGPARHYGYAAQWFGMALAILIFFGFATIKRKSHE
jgi:surfeit locus 1 family protein